MRCTIISDEKGRGSVTECLESPRPTKADTASSLCVLIFHSTYRLTPYQSRCAHAGEIGRLAYADPTGLVPDLIKRSGFNSHLFGDAGYGIPPPHERISLIKSLHGRSLQVRPQRLQRAEAASAGASLPPLSRHHHLVDHSARGRAPVLNY